MRLWRYIFRARSSLMTFQSAARPYMGSHGGGGQSIGNGVFCAQAAANISGASIKNFRIYFSFY